MKIGFDRACVLVLVSGLGLGCMTAPSLAAETQTIKRIATIEVPGEKLAAFDIGFVADGAHYEGFVGPSKSNDTAGRTAS